MILSKPFFLRTANIQIFLKVKIIFERKLKN